MRNNYPCGVQVMYEPMIPFFERSNSIVEFVSNELETISGYFSGLRIAEDLPLPYVFLSDKVIYRSYGELADKDIIKELTNYANSMKKTEMYEYFMAIINCVIQNLEQDFHNNDEDENLEESVPDFMPTLPGAERAVEEEGTEEDKAILDGIIDILSRRKVGNTLVLGEYLTDRHQIMIYYKAIEREVNTNSFSYMDFYAKLSSVIAHEYFHAMHYAMTPGRPLWKNSNSGGLKSYKKKEITEALADFFSVLWCYDRAKLNNDQAFVDVARERFHSWRKNLYSAWPYSKALYLMKNLDDGRLPSRLDDESVRNGREAMLWVFEASLHDIVRAYELLRGRHS